MPPKPSSPEKSPRFLAVEILEKIEKKGAFAEPLLDRYLSSGLPESMPDRRLLTQLVYGTLRMRGRLDWIIAQIYRGNPSTLGTRASNILRTALYQIFFLDRIPEFAIVDEAVGISGGSGLVNAILRNAIRRRAEIVYPDMQSDAALHIAVVHSHPLWLVKKWVGISGREETLFACRANNETPSVTVRINRLKTTRDMAVAMLEQDGFSVRKTLYSPDGLVLEGSPMILRETMIYRQGRIHLQDEASQLAAFLVDPRPGETILDACAGTGGKTAHIAALMENRGSILAIDRDGRKLGSLRQLVERLGVTIAKTMTADATTVVGENLQESFDRVLVDAPCSGLGTLRRNPEIKWRIRPNDIRSFTHLQGTILERAALWLRRGGALVYSTCTVSPEENEEIIDGFLARHGEFHMQRPPDAIDPVLVDSRGFFRTHTHRHGMDGFFGALMRRT